MASARGRRVWHRAPPMRRRHVSLAVLSTALFLAFAARVDAEPPAPPVPPATDEVSSAVATLFGTYGQEYQQLQTQAHLSHVMFTNAFQGAVGAPQMPPGGDCITA